MSVRVAASKGKFSQKVVEDFESRPHKAVSSVSREREGRRCVAVEAGCQGRRIKARGREERRQRRNAERDKSGMKLFKKWLIKKKARAEVDAKQTAQ